MRKLIGLMIVCLFVLGSAGMSWGATRSATNEPAAYLTLNFTMKTTAEALSHLTPNGVFLFFGSPESQSSLNASTNPNLMSAGVTSFTVTNKWFGRAQTIPYTGFINFTWKYHVWSYIIGSKLNRGTNTLNVGLTEKNGVPMGCNLIK